jgi:hypothetical protein
MFVFQRIELKLNTPPLTFNLGIIIMKTVLQILLAATALSSLIGCASIAGDNSKVVHVNSKPEGAKVYANNIPVGTTPTQISVNTWSPTLLTLRKKGYPDVNTQVNTTFQPIGVLNILFWPGFIIDAATGNMMKVAPESRVINADLSRNT